MTLSDFFIATYQEGRIYDVRPRIFCNDGFSMSVQAGYAKYSTPREHGTTFLSYEIGYPSKKEALIMPYVEDAKRPRQTVYGYVPFDVVEAVIAKHGGINQEKSFRK
jgi:hypothetical protein